MRIIETARTFLETPYHHQGRVKGVGVDCLGLIVGVCEALGLPYRDIRGYSRYATGLNLLERFSEQCEPSERGEGKILIFRIRALPCHCAIEASLSGYPSIIHAYQSIGRVDEHILDSWWESRIVGCFSFPEKI